MKKGLVIVLFIVLTVNCFANEVSEFSSVKEIMKNASPVQETEEESLKFAEKQSSELYSIEEDKNNNKHTISIDTGIATLMAAIIAALLSFITLLQNKKTEIREANRKKLELYIDDLSESIHEIMAFSTIMLKNNSEESLKNYKSRADEAKKKLKELRKKIIYPLWGIDDCIQQLTRVSDYTSYTLKDKKVAIKNVKRAKLLAKSIDCCIKNCYIHGRNPTLAERLFIKYRTYRFTKVRNDYRKSHNKDDKD